jgi:hypothetical protein
MLNITNVPMHYYLQHKHLKTLADIKHTQLGTMPKNI